MWDPNVELKEVRGEISTLAKDKENLQSSAMTKELKCCMEAKKNET